MTFRKNHIWILIWGIVYLIGSQIDCTELLGTKGFMSSMGNIIAFSPGCWYMSIYFMYY